MASARQWHDCFPAGSIALKIQFSRYFSQKKKTIKKKPQRNTTPMKRGDEPVEDIMEWSIMESIQIQDVPKVMKISNFINGVQNAQL